MRLQFSLRVLFFVTFVMAALSIWQRDRAAKWLASLAAEFRRGEQSQQHEPADAPAAKPDDRLARALREFAILEAESEESRRRFTAEAQAAAHRFMNSPPISKEEFMKDRGKAIRERYGIDPNEPTNRELLLPTELPGLGDL